MSRGATRLGVLKGDSLRGRAVTVEMMASVKTF